MRILLTSKKSYIYTWQHYPIQLTIATGSEKFIAVDCSYHAEFRQSELIKEQSVLLTFLGSDHSCQSRAQGYLLIRYNQE
jgi:hypothetical protein